MAIAIKQEHKRFQKLPITLLFWHDVLKCFWTEIFSLIEQVQAFLDLIFSRALANQNNSVINSYYCYFILYLDYFYPLFHVSLFGSCKKICCSEWFVKMPNVIGYSN